MMKDLIAAIILIAAVVALFMALPRVERYFLEHDYHGDKNEAHR